MGFNVHKLFFLSFFSLALLVSMHLVGATKSHKVSPSKRRKELNNCNLFSGSWVIGSSYTLYDSSSCPFLEAQFDCQKFGRLDNQYLKYSWKPDSCALPRFNGEDFLNRWKGKKIMFVGDSLSLNMWESLSCMIHASVPNATTSFSRKESMSTVIFQDYGVTIQLYRTPYLVDIIQQGVGRVLTLDSINAGKAWIDMDMLIFNSWHWWTHKGDSQGWDFIKDGPNLVKDMDRLDAFYKGLTTWAGWVDANVDPTKTKVFFQGISPTHYQGQDWNEPRKTCSGEVEPVPGPKYPAALPPEADVVNRVLKNMKKQVYLLDITLLSQLRKDGHPSIYTKDHTGNDCSHWCLPGLPDTWNILLNAALIM